MDREERHNLNQGSLAEAIIFWVIMFIALEILGRLFAYFYKKYKKRS
jgi:hypothetical protein